MSSGVKSLLLLAVCFLLNFPSSNAQSQPQGTDCRSCTVVERALRDFQGIKVGMSRRDIERFFVVAGGMTFRNHTSYVYRDCEYLRVDVDFKPDTETENTFSPDDKITATSQITVSYPAKD
jgi:hypothetical protein